MTPRYQRVSFLANLMITLLKVCYRIFESACSTFCSFFVSEKSVRDEIVLITGAGHGMGREFAFQYARLGATVVCLDINQQTNESTANEIAKTIGTPVYSYQAEHQAAMIKAYNGALVLADVLLLILKLLYYICESVYKLFVPSEEKSVAGEIVLITGTGHGIGKELALRYASLGATVVCWDLNPQGNEETVNEIKKMGSNSVYAYKCDVSNREEVLEVASRVQKEVGDVTILVNNAGVMPCHTFLEHTTDEIRRTFDINVLAHFWMLQAFLPSMIKKNHGHIVALSSLAGLGGFENLVPYCASKFAVRGLMEAMSEELRISSNGKSLIKFTTIYPYMVDTGLCKKPRIKYPDAMPMVSPHKAASEIIKAQRQNQREKAIPRIFLALNLMIRNLPDNAIVTIKDFANTGVDSDS